MPTRTAELTIVQDQFADDAIERVGAGTPLGLFFDVYGHQSSQVQTYLTALEAKDRQQVPVGGLVAVHQNVLTDGYIHVTGIEGSDDAVEPMLQRIIDNAALVGRGVLAFTSELTPTQREIFVTGFGARAIMFAQRQTLQRAA